MRQPHVQVASVAGSYSSVRRPVADIWALVIASQFEWWAAYVSEHVLLWHVPRAGSFERREALPLFAHSLNGSSCKSQVFRWFCVICFPSHQFVSAPALLPYMSSSSLVCTALPQSPEALQDQDRYLSFLISLVLNFHDSTKILSQASWNLAFLFSFIFPVPPFLCPDCQHFYTAALLGALGLNEHPWSLVYAHMAWSPSTQCAHLMLFHHSFEPRQLPCLLWGLWTDFEIVSNYSLVPVCPLFSSALPNSSVQRIVPASHI